MSGPMILAAPVALAAGVVSFISPCCLPLVPGYLSYVAGMSGADAQRTGPVPGGARARAGTAAGPGALGARPGLAVAAGGPVTSVGAGPVAAGRGRTVAGTALFVLGFSALSASYGAALAGWGRGCRPINRARPVGPSGEKSLSMQISARWVLPVTSIRMLRRSLSTSQGGVAVPSPCPGAVLWEGALSSS